MVRLNVAPCSYRAAKYAVLNWHYSQKMPAGKMITLGVWEDGEFIGAVCFGRGANNSMVRPYGLRNSEGVELVRVALREHASPVSQVVSAALSILKRTNPGLRLVVSYADPEQGHLGGIYQAGNWLYAGKSPDSVEYIIKGRRYHGRSARQAFGSGDMRYLHTRVDPRAQKIIAPGKHRYLMPLDKQMRRRLKDVSLPYPRGGGIDSDPADNR